MAISEPFLDIRDLEVRYGASLAVGGASLSLGEGEVVALLGRNGVGKTSLVGAVMGVVQDRRGRIAFRGRETSALAAHDIARLGLALVPQGRRIFPSLTVRETLALAGSGLTGRKAGHRDRWTLERVFETFPRLKERSRQLSGSLSGGEQQMLTIARALMSNPDLILMDEPTEGLAPVIVRQIAGIIRELKTSGQSILLVEQNYRVALDLADRLYVMDGGRLVFEGEPQALAANEEVKTKHLGV